MTQEKHFVRSTPFLCPFALLPFAFWNGLMDLEWMKIIYEKEGKTQQKCLEYSRVCPFVCKFISVCKFFWSIFLQKYPQKVQYARNFFLVVFGKSITKSVKIVTCRFLPK